MSCKEIEKANAEAEKLGISYGEYMARIYAKKQEEEKKNFEKYHNSRSA